MTQERNPKQDVYLGKYKIISRLGQGSMGMVYKGFDPSIERYVALKMVSPHILNMDDATIASSLNRFKQEAKIAGRLSHPHIVSVYEYGEDKGRIFIAMEFVQGKELKDILSSNRRIASIDSCLNLMIQLMEALAHAHEKGVVHRDIKPGNILLTPSGDIKIMDFGIAKIASSELTQMGTLIGTPSYMSPEMVENKISDPRTDIFSAGIVFYQCLVGKKPFEGSNHQVMHKIVNQKHVPPSEMNPELPREIDRIVAKALAKNPDQRYPNADAMLMDLHQMAGTLHSKFSARSSPEVSNTTPEAQIENPLSDLRNDPFQSDMPKRDWTRFGLMPLILSALTLIVAIIAALYIYYDRSESVPIMPPPIEIQEPVKPEKVPSAGQQQAVTEKITDETPVRTNQTYAANAQGSKESPSPPEESSPIVLATLADNARVMEKILGQSLKIITPVIAQKILKLKVAFVSQAETKPSQLHAIANRITGSDRILRVNHGPADLICTLMETGNRAVLIIKNRFISNNTAPRFPLENDPQRPDALPVQLHHFIAKLYAFKTFELLQYFRQLPGDTKSLEIQGSRNNTLLIGDQTDICIFSDRSAYLMLLNINSMNITMLFPNYLNQENFIKGTQTKCSGSMDVYPPTGTEMITAFLLANKALMDDFGYQLSRETSYYVWDYDSGEVFDFCEHLTARLLSQADENWWTGSKIIHIKK